MKNIILIILLSFVAFSCSKDENNEPKPNFPEHLIGKWKMTTCKINDSFLSIYDCQTQVTKNIYDMWFKDNGTYISKTHYLCVDKTCNYVVNKVEIEGYPDYFKITFNPDTDCTSSTCEKNVYILYISKNELVCRFSFGFDSFQEVTYTRVE